MSNTFNHQLLNSDSNIIVGLSGGPDSVALLHWLAKQKSKLNLNIIAAHLNHEWRKDAKRDVAFCEKLCEDLDVVLKTQRASKLKFTPKDDGSKESMARQQRRFFFETLAQQTEKRTGKKTLIALGHHKQDQLETFFIRLIRGTTTSGLCCMQETNGRYIRPLLQMDKATVTEYLDKHLLSYIQDPTNDSDAFLRNRIRNNLLPVLKECDERAPNQIIRTLKIIQETEHFLENQTEKAFETLIKNNVLDIKQFLLLEPFLQKRVIRLWLCKASLDFTLTEKFIQEVIRFLDSPRGGTHQLGTNWAITKKEHKAELVSG